MEFTGERYMPHVKGSEISYEHWHRYHFTKDYIKNKIVADIACGEGYGSFYMSQFSDQVIGVDISEDSIRYATNNYKKENLKFIHASADAVNIEGFQLDVVVSFETIEHLTEEQQIKFILIAKELLKDDGVLIISTPDKQWYSDLEGYKNQYHLKEFYGNEFMDFLNKYFKHTTFFKQRTFPANLIWQDNPSNLLPVCIDFINDKFLLKSNFIANPLYYVAVCSDSAFQIADSSVLIDESLSLFREYNDVIHGKNCQIQQLENELNSVKRQLSELMANK